MEASIERQRSGHFNLYVPRQPNEPENQQSYRGQFESFMDANDYCRKQFGLDIPLAQLDLK